uniref:PWWP domain-containing protein n=1 Tax=Haemonchus placei TaxID=6290 RepID=A0A0N4X8Y3_HAEPC
MEAQYNRHHGAKEKQFNIGDFVWAKDYRSGWPKHTPGQVLQRHEDRLYDIAVNGEIWKRHANQLRLRVMNTPPYQQQNSLSYSCCQCQRQPMLQEKERQNNLPLRADRNSHQQWTVSQERLLLRLKELMDNANHITTRTEAIDGRSQEGDVRLERPS